MLLFIIVTSQIHFKNWYCNNPFLSDWVIEINENSWTINKLGFEWIKHFDQYSRNCTINIKHLLILNSYNNYYLYEFEYYCKENNIVIFYISFYLFHLFQLFDIGYFNILKRLYSKEVENFIRSYINYIIKLNFFAYFYTTFFAIFNKENI